MQSPHYSRAELLDLGIALGDNVIVDRSVRFFGADRISFGSNVRIDCFCLISANEEVRIGSFVHIAPYSCLFGAAGIEVEDYVGLSSRVSVYSVSDDYSGGHLTNPTVPQEFRKVDSRRVTLSAHSVIGSGSVLLPGAGLGRGAAVGALSLVNKRVPDFTVVSGVPARKIGMRDGVRLGDLEAIHRASLLQGNTQAQ